MTSVRFPSSTICVIPEEEEESDHDKSQYGSEEESFRLDFDESWRDPWEDANDRLQQRFMDIFNNVLLYFRLNRSRKALATNATGNEEDDVYYRYEWRESRRPPRFSTRLDIVIL